MGSGIYIIRNEVTQKCYVGSSKDIKQRWRQHRTSLNRSVHRSTHMQRAWAKYGGSNFSFEVVLNCAPSMLEWYEQQVIDAVKPKYNNRKLANSNKGQRHTLAARNVISQASKEMWERPGFREAFAEKRRGAKHSPETIEKLRAAKVQSYNENVEYRKLLSAKAKARSDITRYEYNGKSHTLSEWSGITGLPLTTLLNRVRSGWSVERILTTKYKQLGPLELDGEIKSASEWARLYGLKPDTLTARLRAGRSLRDALNNPLKKGPPNGR